MLLLSLKKMIKYFENNKILYAALGFTALFFIYVTFILGSVSSCFTLDI